MSPPAPAIPRASVDALQALAVALRREGHTLQRRPELLWQQIVNRLQHARAGTAPAQPWPELATELADRRSDPPAPWMALSTDVYESAALVRTFLGHAAQVTSCRFSPLPGAAVSASVDGTARLWNLASGTTDHVLAGHRASIEGCDISPDGSRVVTASTDGTLKVWDAGSGDELLTLEGHDDAVLCCAFGGDGSWLVSGSKDRTCRVWDATSGRCILVTDPQDDPIADCAVSPDGELVASASKGVVTLWDRREGRVIRTLHGPEGLFTTCAFSHDGSRVVTAGWDGSARIWDVQKGVELASIAHDAVVTSASFTADDALLLSSDVPGSVHLYDLGSSTAATRISGHAGPVERCTSSGDATRILSAGDDHTLKLWDLTTALTKGLAVSTVANTRFAAFGSHGEVLVVTDERISVFEAGDAPHGRPIRSVPYRAGGGPDCCCDEQLRVVGTACLDGTLRIQSLDGSADIELPGPGGWLTSCAVSADGQHAAGGSRDGTVTVWDVPAGHTIVTLRGHDERVTGCALSPDARHLVSASWDETLRVWDVTAGQTTATLVGHRDRVSRCALSGDGRQVLSASRDGTARLWDASSGQQLAVLGGHDGAVTSCSFSRDGRLAVTGGEDEAVIVWDLETARALVRCVGVGPIGSCAFDPPGRALCCTDEGGRLYLLELLGLPDRA